MFVMDVDAVATAAAETAAECAAGSLCDSLAPYLLMIKSIWPLYT